MESILLVALMVLGAAAFAWLAPRLFGAHAGDEVEDNDIPNDIPEVPAEVDLPIDGSLDLHTFSPKEVGRLVPDWLDICREKGLREVRIIHGKGKGVLRRQVHVILDRHESVEGYELAGSGRGSWGATVVRLRR